MSKSITQAVLDAQLSAAEGDRIFVNAGQPADYTDASVTKMLSEVTITGAAYTKANGDVSGRKNTTVEQADIAIVNTGDADHVTHADSTGTVIKRVTTCTTQTLTSGGTVTIGAHKHEISDPT